ncbi:putative spermidine/putrescine transport system permease protein [Gibbsiella quercinecans]|uniref:Polyamine ABC transporter permease n=1 Tax=Gibbsiella quercinecans TaxID=929813 RepID=A0A250AYZ6_9GAMM|nr:ABC transporter permease [Gibbsiella quercinecans]ATA19081.1 polyamine ABC transporter permease [Gibbsiella quercinecans]RLM03442.1 polyamine ABC transporter permease [Gibbsiella quercinecans]RLM03655.1 polyamine ABC transporter permease [Gibbsiella quercinecans]RLM07741.1 polyamine ABC transporter permease [Gibbsiella quercinecans]TCT82034.1 putative spermidine/putrescine transport system permease protein [Gibbsiella quercinecans]
MKQEGTFLLNFWRVIFNFYSAAVLLFLIVPVLIIVPLSFNSGSFLSYPLAGFSLRWYSSFFNSPEWIGALGNSLMVAPLATLLATVLGVLASMGLAHTEFRGKNLAMAIIISPMVAPVVIVAVGMFFFFARLSLLNSYLGLVLAHALLGVPFVVITVTAVLKSYDTTLSRAAASLGANPFLVFRKITLPLIAPGVFSGALFAFAASFDEVVVTLFLASPRQRTLPIQMFAGIRENLDPTIAAAATLMIGASLLLLIVMEMLRRRGERMRLAHPAH